jgi:glyoxylase-like metal-dependent hydrolase (beta-lactamase superfamily II)/8-oxo-dGTP pyrophosphatase MutT (NUDIX family)
MSPIEAPPASTIRSACTVVLLRDAAPGLEVLLLRRDPDAKFMPGFHVFAGGAVVPEDRDERATSHVTGIDDREASQRLGIESEGLTYLLAGVRETFEECGMLLAVDEASGGLDAAQWAGAIADRVALNAGTLRFADFLDKHRLTIPGNALVYFDHWLTPTGRPRRFDTRFFLARAPQGQSASHDQAEIVDVRWLRPRDALAMAKRKEIDLANATTTTLAMLAERATVEEALERARSLVEIEPNRPCTAQGSAGSRVFQRKDAAYHEVHWCDPLESMQTTYDLLPGNLKLLDRWVARIIAFNPGPMTGPGTNTYFVGSDELAVIDPGPLDDRHLAALIAHGAGRIRWILCTHTHRDHSPGAARLAAATGAEVIGMPPPADPRHDGTFAPDRVVRDGELIELGKVALTAIHTPGHASNHLCFRLAQNGMLFTGDHVMQGSTVVIGPPDGDMQAYLDSLRRLLSLDIAIMAPGHGYLIGQPHREVRRLIEHRLWREARVLQSVESRGPATVEEMLDDVYPDVMPVLRGPAAQSLTAHLRKLLADGAVTESGGRYRPAVS